MRAVRGLAVLVALALGGVAVAEDLVDNPDYQTWTKVGVDTSIVVKNVVESGSSKKVSDVTIQLLEKNETQIVVEVSGEGMISRHVVKLAKIPRAELAKMEREKGKKIGTQEIETAGKKWDCEVWESKVEGTVTKQWICPGTFPESIVMEVTSAGTKQIATLEKILLKKEPRGEQGEGAQGRGGARKNKNKKHEDPDEPDPDPRIEVSGSGGATGGMGVGIAEGKMGPKGEKGDDGPEVTVTVVWFEKNGKKLLKVTGDSVDPFTFDPAKTKLTIVSRGGQGGKGGTGGRGRDNPSGVAGRGGRGGKGGRGGRGGAVTVFFEAGHPEIEKHVVVESPGGDPGEGGDGGQPGGGMTSGDNGDNGEPGEAGPEGPKPVFKPAR